METRKYPNDVIADVAREIVNIDYPRIEKEGLVPATKLLILDTIGVTIAASGLTKSGRALAETVLDAGGKPESTLLGFGEKVPCWSAAFFNGAMAHCLDFDDIHDVSTVHPSATVVPAALAMAERCGPVSGRDFLTAVVSGGELICKLGRALLPRWQNHVHEWMPTQVLGVFSSTAAAGKLAGLDERQMVEALGIAFTYASGTSELLAPGGTIRGFYDNVPALAGIFSVLMAQKGVTGIKNPLEGQFGLFKTYFNGEYDRSPLEEFGRVFDYPSQVGIKPWPSCRNSHAYIEAALDIMNTHAIKPGDIKLATVFIGEWNRKLCEPAESRRKPKTVMDAKYSIPWCVACACARGKVTLSDFTLEGLTNRDSLDLAGKIVSRFDPEMDLLGSVPPGKVLIETTSGKQFSKRVDHGLGHPDNPIGIEAAEEKFRECVSHSPKCLSRKTIDAVIQRIQHLEDLGDIRSMMEPTFTN